MGSLTRLLGPGLDALWHGDENEVTPLMSEKMRQLLRQENEAKQQQDELLRSTQQVAQPSNSWMQSATGAHQTGIGNLVEDAYQQSGVDTIGHGFNKIMHAIDTPWEKAKNELSSLSRYSPMTSFSESMEDNDPRMMDVNTSVGRGQTLSSPAHERTQGISNFLGTTRQGQDELITRGLLGEKESGDSVARRLLRPITQMGTGLVTRGSNTLPLTGSLGSLGMLASGVSGAHDTLPEFLDNPSIESGANLASASLPALLGGLGTVHEINTPHSILNQLATKLGEDLTTPIQLPDARNAGYYPPNASVMDHLTGKGMVNPGSENWLPPGERTGESPRSSGNVIQGLEPLRNETIPGFPDIPEGADLSVMGHNALASVPFMPDWDPNWISLEKAQRESTNLGEFDKPKTTNETGAVGNLAPRLRIKPPADMQGSGESSKLWDKLEGEKLAKEKLSGFDSEDNLKNPIALDDQQSLLEFKNQLFQANKAGISKRALEDLTRHPAVKRALDELSQEHGLGNLDDLTLASPNGHFHNFFESGKTDELGLRATKRSYDQGSEAVAWPDSPDILQPKGTRTIRDSKGHPIAQLDVVPKVDNSQYPSKKLVDELRQRLDKQGLSLPDAQGSGGNLGVRKNAKTGLPEAFVIDPGAVSSKKDFDNFHAASGKYGAEANKMRQPLLDSVRRKNTEFKNPILGEFSRNSERGAIGDLSGETSKVDSEVSDLWDKMAKLHKSPEKVARAMRRLAENTDASDEFNSSLERLITQKAGKISSGVVDENELIARSKKANSGYGKDTKPWITNEQLLEEAREETAGNKPWELPDFSNEKGAIGNLGDLEDKFKNLEMTPLYRGEKDYTPDWIQNKQGDNPTGRWFTNTPEKAKQYAEGSGERTRVVSTLASDREMKDWGFDKNDPRHGTEFLAPREVVNTALPVRKRNNSERGSIGDFSEESNPLDKLRKERDDLDLILDKGNASNDVYKRRRDLDGQIRNVEEFLYSSDPEYRKLHQERVSTYSKGEITVKQNDPKLYQSQTPEPDRKSRRIEINNRLKEIENAQFSRNNSERGAIGDFSDDTPGYKSNADEVMKDLEESGLGDFVPKELSSKQKRTLGGTQLPNQSSRPIKVDQLFDPETGEDLSEVSRPESKLPSFDKTPAELVAESLSKIRSEKKPNIKKLYHGTNTEFSEQKYSQNGTFGPGMYFADHPESASIHGGKILTRDVDLGNTLNLVGSDPSAIEFLTKTYKDLGGAGNTLNMSPEGLYNRIAKLSGGREKAQQLFENAGYHSITAPGISDNQYVIFDSKQITNPEPNNSSTSETRFASPEQSSPVTSISSKRGRGRPPGNGGNGNKPPTPPKETTSPESPKEPEQVDEASKIKPEDTFSEAWAKLTPGERAKEAWNAPRSVKAILDVPALRQGRYLTVNHPIEAGRSMAKVIKSGFSENEYKLVEKAVESHPDFKAAKEAGLDLAGLREEGKEESFPAPLAEKLNVKIPDKVPLIGGKSFGPGKIIRGSERAYSAYMNPMRIHAFAAFKKQLDGLNKEKKLGKGEFSEEGMKPFYQDAARAINVLSMRGDIRSGFAKQAVSKASSIIWSPRNKIAQAQLLKDLVWNDFNPTTSARFKRYVGTNMALNASLLGLAAAAGASIETDPESSDWGKAKFGNVRWNPWGPMQGLVRSAVLLKTGKRKTLAGQERKTKTGEVLWNYVKNSLHPSAGALLHQWEGENFAGKDITDERAATLLDDTLTPLVADDAYKAAKQYGLLPGLGVLGASVVSEDVRTYDDKEKKTKKPVTPKKRTSSRARASMFSN